MLSLVLFVTTAVAELVFLGGIGIDIGCAGLGVDGWKVSV